MVTCKKESFLTKELAEKFIEIYNNSYNTKEGERKLTMSYHCKKCNTFHLTSQDNYQTKLRKVEKELHETKLLLASRESELLKRIHEAKNLNTQIEYLKKRLNEKS